MFRETMQNTILLATISMICAGLASFTNKLATENQVHFSTFLLLTSIPYLILVFVLKNTTNYSFHFNLISVSLGLIGGTLGCIAFYTVYKSLERGGEGSIIFPITSLQVIIPVLLSIIIFKESITPTKLWGLVFSIIALILLSR